MPPDLPAMLATNDAALLIGDPALRISLAIESLGSAGVPAGVFSSQPSSDSVGAALQPARSASTPSTPNTSASNRPAEIPSHPAHSHSVSPPPAPQSAALEICTASTLGLPTTETLYVYDIVEQWRAMTGLSAVLAVWAARPSVATPDVVADFHASRAFGLLNLPELCDASSAQLRLPAPALLSYLSSNIDFTLDPENISALSQFFAEAASLNLTPPAKPVLLAPGPKPIVLEPAPVGSLRGSLNGRALDLLFEERKRNREL